MGFHKDLKFEDVHAFTTRTYADYAARDADTAFSEDATNIDKIARVDFPSSYWVLLSVGPATWQEFTNNASTTFVGLADTPAAYASFINKLIQVNAAENAMEFTDAPTVKRILTALTGGSVYVGETAGLNDDLTTRYNVGIGFEALRDQISGNSNVGVGAYALASNTVGTDNTAVGFGAGRDNLIGMANTAIGHNALVLNTNSNNTGIGQLALAQNVTGQYNTAVGKSAMILHGSGDRNVAFGYIALQSNSTGAQNTAIGSNAGGSNSTGSGNVFIGYDAGSDELGSNMLYIANGASTPLIFGDFAAQLLTINGSLTITGGLTVEGIGGSIFLGKDAGLNDDGTDNDNVGIGENALKTNVSSALNVAIGADALSLDTTGGLSVAIGALAMKDAVGGFGNVALGYNSLNKTTGNDNIAIGVNALGSNLGGLNNIAFGQATLTTNTIGNYNIGIGISALNKNLGGHQNIAFGFESLWANTEGDNNIAIGHGALKANTVQSGNMAFGNNALELVTGSGTNIAIGGEAGATLVSGSNNVFLGWRAGKNELGSNKLYVAMSDTATPLLGGDFSTGSLTKIGNEIATAGEKITEVWSLSDLPAPVANEIFFYDGTYKFMTSIDFGINSAVIDPGSKVVWIMEDSFSNTLTYSGAGTFIIGPDDATFRCGSWGGVTILMTGNNSTFVEIWGTFGFNFSAVVFTGTGGKLGFVIGPDTGNDVTGVVGMVASSIVGWKTGLTVSNQDLISFDRFKSISATDAVGPFLTCHGRLDNILVSFGNFTLQSATASLFDMQPDLNATVNLVLNKKNSVGAFWEQGAFGFIASFASKSDTNYTMTAVADDGLGGCLFTSSVANTYVRGDIVLHSTFSDSEYNGVFRVTSIITTTQYQIEEIPFTATGTGIAHRQECTVADVAHGLVAGDLINITQTVDYDGGYRVISKNANDFVISAKFVATEVGAWDTHSLDQDSPYINVQECGQERDSRSTAFGYMNENIGSEQRLTTTLDGTYTIIRLADTSTPFGEKMISGVDSRFTLVSEEQAIWRYDGLKAIDVTLDCRMAVVKTGSTQTYRLAFGFFGNVPAYATSSPYETFTRIECKTTTVQVSAQRVVRITPGETIQPYIAGVGTTDSLAITDMTFRLTE